MLICGAQSDKSLRAGAGESVIRESDDAKKNFDRGDHLRGDGRGMWAA
jgi:hypothetical protein